MNKGRILSGLDAGHVNTKAMIMRGQEILGYGTAPTGFDVVAAAETALNHALDTGDNNDASTHSRGKQGLSTSWCKFLIPF